MRIAFLLLIALIIMAFIGQIVATSPAKLIIIIIAGLILSALTIMNLEWGLYIFLFVIPFTLQIPLLPGIEVGTDDFLMLFLIFSWIANRARAKEKIFVSTPLNWPFFLFFVAGAISLIPLGLRFSEHEFMIGMLHFLKFFEYVFIYFIVISCIQEQSQIKKFTLAFFVNVALIAAIQIIQNIIGGPLQLGSSYLRNRAIHFAIGTFESNAILGVFYCFALSVVLGMILTNPSRKTKVILTVFAVVLSYALFNTFARAAYLGIVIAIFALAMILKEKRLHIVFFGLLLLSPALVQPAVLERITLTVQSFSPTLELDPSAHVRVVLWKKAVEIFIESPIIGIGFWGVRYILRSEAHSQFLAVLTEVGVLGFSIFLWLFFRILKGAIEVKNNVADYFVKGVGIGYIAGIVGLLTTCFFSESLEAFRMLGPLWFMTGVIFASRQIALKEKEVVTG